MHPPIGWLDSRPELLCRRQSGLYEPLETAEFKGSPLFGRRRQLSRRFPGAVLSVSIHRHREVVAHHRSAHSPTFRHYPRTTSASSSVRPSRARSTCHTSQPRQLCGISSTHVLDSSLDCFSCHTSLVSEREKTWHQRSGAMRKRENESLSCLWCFQSAFRQTAKQLNVSTMLSLMLDQMM
jgi:hypothetical protein